MSRPRHQLDAAVRHLEQSDPVMRGLIARVGPVRLRLERDRFWVLVRSIISQQISTKAAQSIRRRIEELIAPERPSAAAFAAVSDARLRSAGLSPQKVRYLRDLCAHVDGGELELRTIGRKRDEDVIADLVRVKGIGRWTAQMFLIFSLGRLDVLPHDDLGVRANIRDLYGLDDLPDKATVTEIARPWRPYASIASWYCWRNGDLARAPQTDGYPV